MNRIFTKEEKEKAKKSKRPWYTPLFVSLILNDKKEGIKFKNQIERWFKNLPETEKKHFLTRFRSKNDREHLSTFFELMWNQFFFEENWTVSPHPLIPGSNNKIDFYIKNTKQNFYFEVVTVFIDPKLEKRERLIDELLNKLNEIEHYFLISVNIESWLPVGLKTSKVKTFIKSELDKLDPKQDCILPNDSREIFYDYKGYKIKFRIYGKKKVRKDPIIGSYMGPGFSGPVGSPQIRNRIEEKIKKYRGVEKTGCPFIIGLCSGENWRITEDSLDFELFGKPILVWKEDNPKSSKWERDDSGLFRKHPRLSAAIFCARSSKEIGNDLNIVYKMKLFHNPFAINSLRENVFSSLPQFVVRGQLMKTINDDPDTVVIFH